MNLSNARPTLWRVALLALALVVGLGLGQPAQAQADPDREIATAVPAVGMPMPGVRYAAAKPDPIIAIPATTATTT